jgi:hypothetical protein
MSLSQSRYPFPLDLIRRVVVDLMDGSSFSTLATLQSTSSDIYAIVTPLLYRSLHVHGLESTSLFELDPEKLGVDEGDVEAAEKDGSIYDVSNKTMRCLASLRYVEELTVHSLPQMSLSLGHTNIMPRLKTVRLAPSVIETIRTYRPETYDRPRNPPFIETLMRHSNPAAFHLAFPTPRTQDPGHGDQDGQYNLASRLVSIGATWDLARFVVNDITDQVIPSLPGCENVYHFTSPPDHRGIEWDYRAWQITTAIKSVFPTTPQTTRLKDTRSTSWRIHGVLEGVAPLLSISMGGCMWEEKEEVEYLINERVEVVLRKELGARFARSNDGTADRNVEAVLAAVVYV